jgi:hypothetical protein
MANSTKNYIPDRDAEFDGWLENLSNYVGDQTTWTHIPVAKVTALGVNREAWHAAYVKMLAPHTAVDTEAKNAVRAATEGFVRPFVAQYLKFDPVTDEDRTAMNLHNRDTTPTSVGVPTTQPEFKNMKALGGYEIEIRFHDAAPATGKAIPYGYAGCLLNYAWGADQQTNTEALRDSKLMTRTPWTLSLPSAAKQSYLSCALRWQNKKGELGPWGEIQTVVVA